MPQSSDAKAAAHDAAVSFAIAEPVPAPIKVEGADGWTVSAATAEELRDLAAEKLRQAEQNRADAETAVAHWTEALKAIKAHK